MQQFCMGREMWQRSKKSREEESVPNFSAYEINLELWCWRRLMRVSWTVKEIKPVSPKGNSPEYSLEGLMLKLKLQCFGHLMWRTDWRQEDRGWDGWMASFTHWTWVWARSGTWWWTMKPGMLQSIGSQRVRHDWVTELNWTDDKYTYPKFSFSFSKTLKAGGEGDNRGWDGWMASLTPWTWVWANSVKDRDAWSAAAHSVMKGWTQLSNWTTTEAPLPVPF